MAHVSVTEGAGGGKIEAAPPSPSVAFGDTSPTPGRI